MQTKKIANVVFYNFMGERGELMSQAIIFYNDGTVKNCSYDDGYDAALELSGKEGSASRNVSDVINNENILVMTGKELEKNFNKFIVNEKETISPIKKEENNLPVKKETPIVTDNSKKEETKKTNSDSKKSKILPIKKRNKKDSKAKTLKAANETKTKKKKEGFFSKAGKFFHKAKVRAGAIALSVVLALGGAFLVGKNESKIGKFFNNLVSKVKPVKNDNNNDSNLVYGDNDYYDDYTYSQLLTVNTNEAQKNAMKHIHYSFTKFNKMFANSHLEEGKDIKAALSWSEMNALQQAYNNYSAEEIEAIFNGSVISANKLSQAYRNANLQLMGAYVIETREAPVDMSTLLNTQEGKDFYNKYHQMFLAIKEAEGQDKIDKINAWNQALMNDFPISDEVREVGIAHSDNRIVEQYKLSIVPMVSAVEIMYQNLPVDNTLSQKTIDYFNDTGLCNLADDNFERIERITEVAKENDAEPLFEQYKNAIVNELEAQNNYVVDDAHRDLSQLDAFQKAVNEHNHNLENANSTGTVESYTTTETHTVTDTKVDKEKKKTETSNRDKAVKKAGEEKVKKAENEVDEQIAKENEEEKQKALQQAEETRQDMQSDADKQAERIKEEIAQDDQDLQDDIKNANDKINQNNADTDTSNDVPVNESDFGDHNVDFDENHSDSNGNLDNSVKDLTTDSTGDQSNEPLPDPNATGQVFENSYPEAPADQFVQAEVVPEASLPEAGAPVEVSDQAQSIIEYEEPIEYADPISNEELANIIVEDMANNPIENYEEGYQYVLQ